MRFRRVSRSLLLPAGIVWVTAVAIGSATMLNYAFLPGDAGTPARIWPAGSGIRRDRRRAALLMVAHPRCPCTRASIEELAHVMARARPRVEAYVLFYRPRQFARGWEQTDLWRSASAIPGVTVLADADGWKARRFGAVTSGHVLVYDRAGRLQFTGGITRSRGHASDNVGRDSVIRLLTRGEAARRHTFVYGCPIRAVPAGPPAVAGAGK
jgi:hypothetical protein